MRLNNIKIFILKKSYDIYSVLVNKNNIDKIAFLITVLTYYII